MPIDGLIMEGSSLEQAVKATMARMIANRTIVVFLFTAQNYPFSLPGIAAIGKCNCEIRNLKINLQQLNFFYAPV